jgi:hypothetical protein
MKQTRTRQDAKRWPLFARAALVAPLTGGMITMANETGYLIGYTEHRTDLPGGRVANVMTSRAMVVRTDGTWRRELAPGLVTDANTWTQFAGWSPDSQWVYYTAKVGEAVELMRVTLDGKVEQLSQSQPGVLHYHPKVSPDGSQVVFGATRDGVRQLWVANADGSVARPLSKPTFVKISPMATACAVGSPAATRAAA